MHTRTCMLADKRAHWHTEAHICTQTDPFRCFLQEKNSLLEIFSPGCLCFCIQVDWVVASIPFMQIEAEKAHLYFFREIYMIQPSIICPVRHAKLDNLLWWYSDYSNFILDTDIKPVLCLINLCNILAFLFFPLDRPPAASHSGDKDYMLVSCSI